MAISHGKEGVVKIGTVNIAEVTSWDIEESVSIVDATAMGDESTKHLVGAKSWSGSLTCIADEDDAGQKALAVSSSVDLVLQPDGTGAKEKSGKATIKTRKESGQKDGSVILNISFEGNGNLTNSSLTTV